MVGKLKALLVKHDLFTSRVNVHSFSESALGKAKIAKFPDLGRVVNSTEKIPTAAQVKAYGNNVMIGYKRVTPALVNSYYAAGIRVWVWTMDTYAEYDTVQRCLMTRCMRGLWMICLRCSGTSRRRRNPVSARSSALVR